MDVMMSDSLRVKLEQKGVDPIRLMKKGSGKYWKLCRVCGKDDDDDQCKSVKVCSGCRSVYYCGKKCQIKDWKEHKKVCERRKCGLCGNSTKGSFRKTTCCQRWVCQDTHKYKIGTFSKVSCLRNHGMYTICAQHHDNGHSGDWKECKKCENDWDHNREMYNWYCSNEYNFDPVKGETLPKFEYKKCSKCKRKVNQVTESHSMRCRMVDGKSVMEFLCGNCCI